MKDPGIDANRLAALLDGRLDERERAELLARLAQSDDDYEVLADTAAVLEELEAAGVGRPRVPEVAAPEDPSEPERPGERDVIPLRPRPARGWHRPGARWGALAAVLAGVALVSVLWSRMRPVGAGDPGRLAALLEARDEGLPEGWTERRPWGRTRSAAGDPLTREARAVRLGALLVDLELAVGAQDAAATSRLAGAIEDLLSDVPASGPIAAEYRDLQTRSGASPGALEPALKRGRESVAAVAGEDFVGLGAWAEAARLAAVRHDAGFFEARATRAALERAAELGSARPELRAVVERVRAAARPGGTPDWAVLQRATAELLRTAAG